MTDLAQQESWFDRTKRILTTPLWGSDGPANLPDGGPLATVGGGVGLVGGMAVGGAIGGPLGALFLGPVAAGAGYLLMTGIARIERRLRSRGWIGAGGMATASLTSLEALGGGAIGGALAILGGFDAASAFAATASVVGGLGWARRILQARWIDQTVLALGGHAHTGTVEDYSLEHDLVAAGHSEKAIELFEERSEASGDDPAPLIEGAQTFMRRGRWDESIALYAKVLEIPGVDAGRASAITRQIREICDRRLSRPQSAVPYLERLVELHPDAPEVEWAWSELTVGETIAAMDTSGVVTARVPAVKAVEEILNEAFQARASDIHLEDYEGGLRVRYRIDGMLQDAPQRPRRIRAAILARVRVMAGLNPAESPLPQDARIRLPWGGRLVDVRVSTVPTLHGESIALRILDTERGRLELDQLGFSERDRADLGRIIARPNGMILTTGPGGSGKSTTLHAVVRHLSTGREKIFTVEDPVEYALEGVNQVSVNEKAGLTFARLLRSLVRQDPDVMLIGEIRDAETAELATHAALTGHLVLSTLHTTDALSAMHRLVEIGVPEYMVVHTLEAVIAQRLVRRICDDCATPRPADASEAALLEVEPGTEVTEGAGCEACRGTGYRGRMGVFEFVRVDEELRQAFLRRASGAEIAEIAKAGGMRRLADDARQKVLEGQTTIEELVRITTGEAD